MEHQQPCHKTSGGRETAEDDNATAASKVLGNDDLLGEILHRVDSPTTLVRAAAASKRWLRRASDQAFLRRFRERHPHRLLGFYVSAVPVPLHTEFVPMGPLANNAAAVLPRFSRVWDCRNGRVLFEFDKLVTDCCWVLAVRDPGRATVELPLLRPTISGCFRALLLPDGGRDDATCYRIDVQHDGRSVSAKVTVLRSGAWTVLCRVSSKLAKDLEGITDLTVLTGGKVYIPTVAGFILGVDLTTANLFTIELPEGVAYEYYGNLVPCRGDDAALYLFHVKGDRLSVWLRRRMDDDAGDWVLRDTVSVREACGHLVQQGSSSVAVVGVGDNAEFAFLELGEVGDSSSVVVYLHLASRRAEKVYQRDPENDDIIQVHPLVMGRRPIFPALDSDEGKQLRHGRQVLQRRRTAHVLQTLYRSFAKKVSRCLS